MRRVPRARGKKLLVATAGAATMVIAGCTRTMNSGNLMPPPECPGTTVRSYETFECVDACEPGTSAQGGDYCRPLPDAGAGD